MKVIDTCWVYVLQDKDSGEYDIELIGDGISLIGEDFPEVNAGSKKQVVFRRKFNDTLAALGYKHILQKLSLRSLARLVERYEVELTAPFTM